MPEPRVLVVDDDPALRRMLQLLLTSEGFDVVLAEDGLDALEQLDAAPFDAVLLDLQMPRMDGRATFREMRARGHRTPTIVLSAFSAESARSELGADASLAKPFDVDQLLVKVSTLINDHAHGDSIV